MALDVITSNHLYQIGYDSIPGTDLLKMNEIMAKPRVLDKPVHQLKLSYSGQIESCGIKEKFRFYYNECYTAQDITDYVIQLPQGPRRLSRSVYSTLKALLFLSTGRDEELCKASATMFVDIATAGNESVEDKDLYEVVTTKAGEYYTDTLHDAIVSAVFSSSEVLMYWRKISDCDGYYTTAIDAGERYIKEHGVTSTKELDKILSTAYKEAKADKKWMSMLLKNVPSKKLVGMMWLLYPQDSSVIEPGSASSDGFMTQENAMRMLCTMSKGEVILSFVYPALSRRQRVAVPKELLEAFRRILAVVYMRDKNCSRREAEQYVSSIEDLLVSSEESDASNRVLDTGGYYVCLQ